MRCLFFLLLPWCTFAQGTADYYQGTENLAGYELKSKLQEIISQKNISWNYSDLPGFYGKTDLDHYYDFDASNDSILLDIYSNNPTGVTAYHYTKEQLIGPAGAEGDGYNREHIMPQSTFNSNYPMYSDLFIVIPTDARINQRRSNYPYGIATAPFYYTFTNGSRIGANATPNSGYTGRVYEPHDEFKGDIARSLLYYSVRYEGKLGTFKYNAGTSAANDTNPFDGTEEKAFEDWYLGMLLKWHREDPVSPRELERNDSVYIIQQNRNPFIDHPEWVELIWNQTQQGLPATLANVTAVKTGARFVTLNWSPSNDENILGYKIFQNGTLIGTTKYTEFTADHLQPATSYEYQIRSYNNQYIESELSNALTVSTAATDDFAADLMITKYLEGTDDNHALEITNKTGHSVNLSRYRISIQMYSGTNYYFPAPMELEGIIGHNETAVILHPRANFSCITNDEAQLVSAAPQMTFNGSNYVELRYLNTTVDAIGTRDLNNYESLQNVSLYRLASVEQPSKTFNLSEWSVNPVDYCENVGVLAIRNTASSKENIPAIFPNPVGDYLSVKYASLKSLKKAVIIDVSGRILRDVTNELRSTSFLEVKDLKPGFYLLMLDQRTIKFLKK